MFAQFNKNIGLRSFRLLILGFLIGFPILVSAQEKEKKWTLDGYVKDLQTVIVNKVSVPALGIDTTLVLQDNLIHNRLNFEWFPHEKFSFKADLRTRLFWGDIVSGTPNYGEQINTSSNDFFTLSALIIDNDYFIAHSVFDRFYGEFFHGNWEVKLGRQRINWGINTVWNPNDIYNALSFTDFDYEERPGSDALLVRYNLGFASSIEFAVKAFDDWDDAIAAALFKFNKWNYDFQILSGIVQNDLVFGGGWAGNIKTSGFKGEFSYFHPLEDDSKKSFAASLAFDYSFKKGFYVSSGYLFNSNGRSNGSISDLFSFELSAKNLYPYKHAIFTQGSYPMTPLLNGSLALIYSPVEAHALFLNPFISYSIASNWSLDMIGQIVFNKVEQYESPIQAIFLRIKYSF